jgi:FMN phosphatase YigB (HAD superfamily)
MKPEIVMWQYRHFNSDGHPYGWISHDNEKDWAGSLRGHAAAKLHVESRELVTHAHYQRRDDEANAVVADMQELYAKLHADYRELEEELAALRVRVGETK